MNMKLPLTTMALVIVNSVLVCAIGWRLIEGSQRTALMSVAAIPADVATEAVDSPATLMFDAIQARAVFYKTRSFYIAPPPQIAELPPPDFKLAGAMSVPGKQSALLIHAQTGVRSRVVPGDEIAGWTVASIEPNKVIVRYGARTAEITAVRAGGVTMVNAQTAPGADASPSGIRVIGNGPSRPSH